MSGRVDGKVALISGAARGQGRSHAVRLAAEGADIIALDVCADIESIHYPGPTEADLHETIRLVEELDRRVVAHVADVRRFDSVRAAVQDGVAELGRLDIVVANAGVMGFGQAWELTELEWQTMIDINLTGVWNTVRAAIPILIDQGAGGSIIMTSSAAGLAAIPHTAHYVAAKHGVVGLMRSLAVELASHRIRVNSVHPTTVDTEMINNQYLYTLLTGGDPHGTREAAMAALRAQNAFPIAAIDPLDVSNAVLYLASDDARFVTGTTLVVDAGALAPFKLPHA
ncbi:mycofactocin-coupled SDR family oxidoreductase [Pseudonocardia spinosispora]|uniref:mycofactocin-coupled SDR family oxidoreductase n=1 Tax=Pseudonocardia spinosispora TaxID=103441 RepID=UPI0004191D84|nr:mycofactocin-coupled SDR family oxidoreductase [Pseudonocardia spinosispora]